MIHAGKQWDDETTYEWEQRTGTQRVKYSRLPNGVEVVLADGVVSASNGHQVSPLSSVVAVATITGQHEAIPHLIKGQDEPIGFTCSTFFDPDNPPVKKCSPWALAPTASKPMWHWEIADVRPLTEPVPAKGRQGLWIPDTELVEAVEGQL